MDIGFLREAREKADLTQEEMAQLMPMSRPSVSKLERGERALKFEDCVKWMQVVVSRLNTSNTTPLEAGVAFINGVDIVTLTETLTQFVSGFINFIY